MDADKKGAEKGKGEKKQGGKISTRELVRDYDSSTVIDILEIEGSTGTIKSL